MKDIVITVDKLKKKKIDIQNRDIIIAFNEPAFKKSNKDQQPDLDSKLNARLPAYFLPAIYIAEQQAKRPRLLVVSGIFMAARWNAQNETERRIMLVNNILKITFLQRFFSTFFKDTFSIIDFRNSYDFLKTTDSKLDKIWNLIEKKYPIKIDLIKKHLLKFKNPKLFANREPNQEELIKYFHEYESDLRDGMRYAIVHLFVLADINIGWDFAHNSNGYCSIGEHQEAVFNIIRDMGYDALKEVGELVFDQPVFAFENLRIVIENKDKVPPPYNGATRSSANRGTWLDEVTFENNESLDYYGTREKLKPQMENIYEAVGRQEVYEKFWNDFREEYFDLKARLKEAYQIERDF